MKANDFDRIARGYDVMSNLVFGRSIKKSQTCYLNLVSPHSRVLVLGGGTGWILRELDNLQTPIDITYIDASGNMIEASKKRAPFKHLKVQYIQGTQADIPDSEFDVVITNYFLDVFDKNQLPIVVKTIDRVIAKEGIWIVTDFVNAGWWQNVLIKIMYIFFRWVANLSGSQLLSFEHYLNQINREKVKSIKFHYDMIEAAVYQ